MKLVDTAAFPAASDAWQATVVPPSGNVLPEAGEHVATREPSTASEVEGLTYVTTAPAALVASSIMSACAAMTGAVVSWTFTTKLVETAALPATSDAWQATVVSPSGKVLPEAGEHVAMLEPSTASEVEGLTYVTTAPVALVAS